MFDRLNPPIEWREKYSTKKPARRDPDLSDNLGHLVGRPRLARTFANPGSTYPRSLLRLASLPFFGKSRAESQTGRLDQAITDSRKLAIAISHTRTLLMPGAAI